MLVGLNFAAFFAVFTAVAMIVPTSGPLPALSRQFFTR
jgi:hypothetical protein